MIRTLSAARDEADGLFTKARVDQLAERGLVVVDRALLDACSRLNFETCVLVRRGTVARGQWVGVERDAYAKRGETPAAPLFQGQLDDCLVWASAQDAGVREVERVSAERRGPR